MEVSSHLYPLNKDGYALTVTEIKDFVFSLAENYDIELENKDVFTTAIVNWKTPDTSQDT